MKLELKEFLFVHINNYKNDNNNKKKNKYNKNNNNQIVRKTQKSKD